MKHIFVSQTLPAEDREALSRFGAVSVLSPLASLPRPISSHPDTLFALVGGKLFTFGDYICGDGLVADVIRIRAKAGDKYPLDAALNCFEIGGVTFGRKKSLAAEVIDASGEIADVNQGYAHCATAVFPSGLISSDRGIIKAAESRGIKALEISPEGVLLDGYNCGFIGGACVYIDGKALFFGDLFSHADGDKIADFLTSMGIEAISLSGHALTDCGSGLVLAGK